MREFARQDRVGAQIQRELSLLLVSELNDPRFKMVTIQEVRVSRDLSHAKVYFTTLDDEDVKQTAKALNHAAVFMRRRLGEAMKMRSVPQLHFVYDSSLLEGNRLSALIDDAVSHDQLNQSSQDSGLDNGEESR